MFAELPNQSLVERPGFAFQINVEYENFLLFAVLVKLLLMLYPTAENYLLKKPPTDG